jgi:hypothetical protein
MEPKFLPRNLKMEHNQMLCQQSKFRSNHGRYFRKGVKNGWPVQQLLYFFIIFSKRAVMDKQQFSIVLLHKGTRCRSSFHTMPSENVEIIRGPNFPQIFGQLT